MLYTSIPVRPGQPPFSATDIFSNYSGAARRRRRLDHVELRDFVSIKSLPPHRVVGSFVGSVVVVVYGKWIARSQCLFLIRIRI